MKEPPKELTTPQIAEMIDNKQITGVFTNDKGLAKLAAKKLGLPFEEVYLGGEIPAPNVEQYTQALDVDIVLECGCLLVFCIDADGKPVNPEQPGAVFPVYGGTCGHDEFPFRIKRVFLYRERETDVTTDSLSG